MFNLRITCLVLILLALAAVPALGQDGAPPANVVTATAQSGSVTPQAVFVGTVYFPEVSAVAAEVAGRVEQVAFDEGDRMNRGQVMASLDTAILEKELAAQEASLRQALASLEKARLDLSRMERLYGQRTVSEQEYDDARFTVLELEGQADALARQADTLRISLDKAHVRAPFAGVVLERNVDRGEWLSAGATVATLARDDQVEVRVNVPAGVFRLARPGLAVEVEAAGVLLRGRVASATPSGDQATRTFPVRILAKGADGAKGGAGLAQGMEARVRLPVGGEVQAVLVPRDAVIPVQGQDMVYTVVDSKAQPLPVTVQAYNGMTAAVIGPGLAKDMPVVVKGHERLRPGQPVNVQP